MYALFAVFLFPSLFSFADRLKVRGEGANNALVDVLDFTERVDLTSSGYVSNYERPFFFFFFFFFF